MVRVQESLALLARKWREAAQERETGLGFSFAVWDFIDMKLNMGFPYPVSVQQPALRAGWDCFLQEHYCTDALLLIERFLLTSAALMASFSCSVRI